ncbi:MAG TPA: hypothetical protein VGA69_03000 [Nitriliruptorales bacterium]
MTDVYRRILHHTYANGRATDASGNGNHGVPTQTAPGTGDVVGSLYFNGHGSRVDVPPSADLADLQGLRVRVRVKIPRWWWWWLWWTWHWLPHVPFVRRWWWRWWWLRRRHNLVEGHLSFALFVQPNRSVRGTILDANGMWRGPVTQARVVKLGQWHTIEFGHDGVVSAAIAVDGVTQATMHDLAGPVRGVGPKGVTVGHWPEPPHVYSLHGWIDDLEIWREEPDPERTDDCCGSVEVADGTIDDLKEEGWDATRAKQVYVELERFEADLRVAVTGGDPARAAEVALLAARGSSAVSRGDAVEAVSALGATLQLFADRLTDVQLDAFRTRAEDLVMRLPLAKLLRRALQGDRAASAAMREVADAFCRPSPPVRDPRDREHEQEPVPVRLGDPHTDGDELDPPGSPEEAIVGWKPTEEDRERHERQHERRREPASDEPGEADDEPEEHEGRDG